MIFQRSAVLCLTGSKIEGSLFISYLICNFGGPQFCVLTVRMFNVNS
jgi:hypothetical protein